VKGKEFWYALLYNAFIIEQPSNRATEQLVFRNTAKVPAAPPNDQ
jgi:hypothetical protein